MLNTLFIILLILILLPYLFRWLAPFFMTFLFRRLQKNLEKTMNQAQNPTDLNQDFYNTTQQNSKSTSAQQELGDYVDFEEIKDENQKE